MVAIATSLRCRVSAVSAFCRLTTQTHFITNCLFAVVYTKPVNSNFSPKIGCHGNVREHRWTPGHLTHDSYGPSKPTTQTASLSVHPFLRRSAQSVPILYNGTPLFPQNCPFPWGNLDPDLIHGSLSPPKFPTQTVSRSVQPFLQGSLV